MKNLLLGILLAVCIQSFAIVKRADGSVILTADEAQAIYSAVEAMTEAGRRQAEHIKALELELQKRTPGRCI